MSDFKHRLLEEHRRLQESPSADEKPGGIGTVRFVAWCSEDAENVIERAKSVLLTINEHSAGEWPSDEQWIEMLPAWFKEKCAPERSVEEEERLIAWRRTLSEDEQARLSKEEPWPVSNWIYWFMPENRSWYWWDAKPLDAKVFAVAVEVDEWPFPSGGLAWLFRASGAIRFEAEE